MKEKIAINQSAIGNATANLERVEAHASNGATRRADAMAFLRAFMAHPLEVASVVPSSVYLEDRIVRAANFHKARCVVELGPGTGGTTRAMLRSMAPQARLLAIDLNPEFCERLSKVIDDPRLTVHAGSSAALGATLKQAGLPAPELIVSGIPFSTLPRDVAERTAAEIASSLAPGGRFVAYQWRKAYLDRYITPHFGVGKYEWEWRALPPMRVFVWDKPV